MSSSSSSSPWATIAKVEPVDFQDIMSEQYAHTLQSREDKLLGQQLAASQQLSMPSSAVETIAEQQAPSSSSAAATTTAADNDETAGAAVHDSGDDDDDDNDLPAALLAALQNEASRFQLADYCDSDRIIAEMMQAQFDRDHDDELRRFERAQNKGSKVSVSFSQYRRVAPASDGSDSDDGPAAGEPPHESRHWDRFERNERIFDGLSKRGFTYDQDGVKVTKHDEQLNGVRNACRVMSFPPEFRTGDAAGFDMKLPNSVFNQLKTYARKAKRTTGAHHKAHDRRENVATAELGLDAQTALILYKLVNNEVLQNVNGVISTGKEAVILHAAGNPAYDGELLMPRECAIKIFKTTLNEFKQRDRYIRDDYRFKDRFSKQNTRAVINMWAEKEMHNLMRMQQAGIRCPQVLMLRKNLLLMTFVGENMLAAPKLKDVQMTPAAAAAAHGQVIAAMHTLYGEAKLVHADLSEYNILWHEGECVFIDVAQAVEPGHPSALEFLMRDCGNISTVSVFLIIYEQVSDQFPLHLPTVLHASRRPRRAQPRGAVPFHNRARSVRAQRHHAGAHPRQGPQLRAGHRQQYGGHAGASEAAPLSV